MIRFMARNIERCDDLFFQGFLGVTWSNSKKETAIQYVSTRSLFFIDLEGVDNSLRYQYRIYDLCPTSCLFIVSGGKLGNFQVVIHLISIGYIGG